MVVPEPILKIATITIGRTAEAFASHNSRVRHVEFSLPCIGVRLEKDQPHASND